MSQPTPAIVLIVVDDDEPLLASLKWAFEVEGYAVRAFLDAGSVLAAVDLPVSGCLVLDYRLPDMDGLELLQRLRQRGVALPAILVTTPAPGIARAARAAGVPLVEKPLMTSALLDQVQRMTT